MAKILGCIFLCVSVVSVMSGCYYYPSGAYSAGPDVYQYEVLIPEIYVYPYIAGYYSSVPYVHRHGHAYRGPYTPYHRDYGLHRFPYRSGHRHPYRLPYKHAYPHWHRPR